MANPAATDEGRFAQPLVLAGAFLFTSLVGIGVGCKVAGVSETFAWIGKFVTSTGFGGLMAALAAVLAYQGTLRRIHADQEMARQQRDADLQSQESADALARWWDVSSWVWENRRELTPYEREKVIESLRDSMIHKPHGAILVALTSALMREDEHPEEVADE